MRSGLIVAAGRGTRMGTGTDKLFIELAGKPVLVHAWLKLDQCPLIDEVVLVTREECMARLKSMADLFGIRKPFKLVVGGAQRQNSVWNGLKALSSDSKWVAIQDGARPVTSAELICLVIRAAEEHGAAVAASPVTDTIKETDGHGFIKATLDRERLRSVQTPQAFQVDIIRNALVVAREKGMQLTDDTAACELTGQKVKLIEHPAPNPKVTTLNDLKMIEHLLEQDICTDKDFVIKSGM